MTDERLLESILDYHPRGRRHIGRPRKRCTEEGTCL